MVVGDVVESGGVQANRGNNVNRETSGPNAAAKAGSSGGGWVGEGTDGVGNRHRGPVAIVHGTVGDLEERRVDRGDGGSLGDGGSGGRGRNFGHVDWTLRIGRC